LYFFSLGGVGCKILAARGLRDVRLVRAALIPRKWAISWPGIKKYCAQSYQWEKIQPAGSVDGNA
jgi:hypothetical protein